MLLFGSFLFLIYSFYNNINTVKQRYCQISFYHRFAAIRSYIFFIIHQKRKHMKKFFLATLIALIGLAQQALASDIVNNTGCSVKVTALVYNTSTCNVTLTCMTVTVPAHSTATLPGCVASGTTELLGFEVCWADVICATIPCISIGNITGAHPCTQFPLGPVYLPACSGCSPTTARVKVAWDLASTSGNLVIG